MITFNRKIVAALYISRHLLQRMLYIHKETLKLLYLRHYTELAPNILHTDIIVISEHYQ